MIRPYWILKNGEPVHTDDHLEWGVWFESTFKDDSRRVASTDVGHLNVSTVFLGLDHRFIGDGPPLLYETMIFGADEEYCERWTTWQEAEAGHQQAVRVAELKLKGEQ